jgi:hypothetical protein
MIKKVDIEKDRTRKKIIIVALLGLLLVYPLFMKVDYTSIDFTMHSQIHWFIPLPMTYIVIIQLVLIIGFSISHHKPVEILPFVVTYILVSGFIIAQLPYTIQGDNLLHGANAKLINLYERLPPYSNAYAYKYPSLFMLSSILGKILDMETIPLNTLLVAWLHIAIAITLYVFLKEVLDEREKVLAPLICALNFLGNFHLTYFLSIFTPRLLAVPLFYLLLYAIFKGESKTIKIISALLIGAIIIGHPITPLYMGLSVMGLLICTKKHYLVSRLGLFFLILISWFAWLTYRANYDFEWAVKLAFGQLESPWHVTYGVSSPFIQEQLDFSSKDPITSSLRAYRLLITIFPYLIGGIVAGYYVLRTVLTKGKVNSRKAPLSFASLFMFIGSLVFYIISGRGHDYFYLFSYPLFLSLAFPAITTHICSSSRSENIKIDGCRLLILVASTISIILLPLSFLSIHSTRVYIGPSDYGGLTFLTNFAPDKDVSTTGDIFYDYAIFNPSYFWPGKTGRILLIYVSPQELVEQSKEIPYVFEGDVAIRSSKQVFGLYFSGLSPDFWKSVDYNLAKQRNKVYDNGNMLIWSK